MTELVHVLVEPAEHGRVRIVLDQLEPPTQVRGLMTPQEARHVAQQLIRASFVAEAGD